MSGGRFLVSLCEVQHSRRILSIDKLLKEEMDFWEEDLAPDNTEGLNSISEINNEVPKMSAELLECHLSEVAITIAGIVGRGLMLTFYIGKELNAKI